jgi:peroxiredoxin
MKVIRLTLISIFVFSFSVPMLAQSANKAEAFTASTLEGKTVDLARLRGKVVLLTFWSTRCVICQSEIPNLNSLVSDYSGKQVVFLAASTEDEDILESYLKSHPFRFRILPNSFGLMLKYSKPDREGRANIAYPAYYLIDRMGYIKYHDYGWDKAKPIADAIDKALAN